MKKSQKMYLPFKRIIGVFGSLVGIIVKTPQLLNVFVDQMTFISPRPNNVHNEEFLRECREKYSQNAYEVKPGISGYAQIKTKENTILSLKLTGILYTLKDCRFGLTPKYLSIQF